MIAVPRGRLASDERGSIAPLMLAIIIALFMIGGLVVDGSRALNARGEAQAYAEEAARAGATAVVLSSVTLKLDKRQATARVDSYCAAVMRPPRSPVTSCGLDRHDSPDGFSSAPTCDGHSAEIVVHTIVHMRINTTLLGMVGPTSLTSTGRAKARPAEGTDSAGNAC